MKRKSHAALDITGKGNEKSPRMQQENEKDKEKDEVEGKEKAKTPATLTDKKVKMSEFSSSPRSLSSWPTKVTRLALFNSLPVFLDNHRDEETRQSLYTVTGPDNSWYTSASKFAVGKDTLHYYSQAAWGFLLYSHSQDDSGERQARCRVLVTPHDLVCDFLVFKDGKDLCLQPVSACGQSPTKQLGPFPAEEDGTREKATHILPETKNVKWMNGTWILQKQNGDIWAGNDLSHCAKQEFKSCSQCSTPLFPRTWACVAADASRLYYISGEKNLVAQDLKTQVQEVVFNDFPGKVEHLAVDERYFAVVCKGKKLLRFSK